MNTIDKIQNNFPGFYRLYENRAFILVEQKNAETVFSEWEKILSVIAEADAADRAEVMQAIKEARHFFEHKKLKDCRNATEQIQQRIYELIDSWYISRAKKSRKSGLMNRPDRAYYQKIQKYSNEIKSETPGLSAEQTCKKIMSKFHLSRSTVFSYQQEKNIFFGNYL